MHLTPEQWERVKRLYSLIVEMPDEDQRAALLKECPDDEDVRDEVERLLGLNAERGSFLDTRPVDSQLFKTQTCKSGVVLAGRFRVLRFLARGGMGEVYEAEDLELQENVAIKLIRREVLQRQTDAEKRFRREIRLAKQVTHPNVCRVFDLFHHPSGTSTAGEDPKSSFIFVTMELLKGETLSQRLRRSGKMSKEEALPIILQMAAALQAAHERQIVHRDFKPGNVFLVRSGDSGQIRVVVTDFGLAVGMLAHVGDQTLSPITTDELIGTPAYMSPEQLEARRDLTPASDVYSMGLVIYQMVTGKLPFENETPFSMAARRLRDPFTSPRSYAPDLDRSWESVILRCLERDPGQRFTSAGQVASALTIPDATTGRPKRTRLGFKSLAVLPFANVSGSADTDYLSDGITESIINTLSPIPELRVIARSSAFRYKDREIDPQAAGRQLNVRFVLVGRVVLRSESLNVAAELVDVETGWQLWGQNYKRSLQDIIALQEEIAQQISDAMRLKLSKQVKRRIAKRPTRSTPAYDSYLMGRFYWNRRTEADIRRAIEYFNQAIQMDPSFAQPYVGLADSYATLGFFQISSFPPTEVMPKARAAAIRALEIDDTLAEAHASLGMVTMRFDWNLQNAQGSFQRALGLNAACSSAYQWSGECWAAVGKVEEALTSLKHAQEFDPLSLTINAVLGGMYYFARQYDSCIEQCHKTLEMDGNFWPALKFLGLAYLENGDSSQAIEVLEQGVAQSRNNPLMVATLGNVYARAGIVTRANALLEHLGSNQPHSYVPSLCAAFIHLGLGNADAAFLELGKSLNERSAWLIFAKVDPRFDILRGDERFDALLHRVGLFPLKSAA